MLARERIQWRQHPQRFTADLKLRAEELLRYKQWSLEQIVGRLRLEGVKMVIPIRFKDRLFMSFPYRTRLLPTFF